LNGAVMSLVLKDGVVVVIEADQTGTTLIMLWRPQTPFI